MPELQRIGQAGYLPPHVARLNALRHAAAVSVAEQWRPIVQPLVEDGASLQLIAEALAFEGLKTDSGRPLAKRTVSRMVALLGLRTRSASISAADWAESIRPVLLPLLAQGYGLGRLAAALEQQGIRSRRGNKLTPQAVRDLLKRLGLKSAGLEVPNG